MSAPVEFEALEGWRAWQVVERADGPALRSLWLNVTWPAREALHARCGIHGSRPATHHVCGIHAFAARDAALAYVGRNVPRRAAPFAGPDRLIALAYGRVSGWGRAVRHTHGWRSEFAYPYALFLLGGDRGLARAVAERYLVDAEPAGG